MTGSQWLTWDEAAALVGCPVSTIDSHKRQGRIRSRGNRVRSLERASVEEFAQWWNARQDARRQRRERPRAHGWAPPEPQGWLSSAAAGEVMGLSGSHVGYLVNNQRLPGTRRNGRLWVRARDANAYAAEESRWISMEAAAAVVGVSASTINKAAAKGDIEQRRAAKRVPSLNRSSVEQYAQRHRLEVAQRDKEAARKRASVGPPDDGQVWFGAATTAAVLGLSTGRIGQLARQGRLPYTQRGARRWFSRTHIEQIAAARAFEARRR